MSSKNDLGTSSKASQAPIAAQKRSRSLRFRLLLWYGTLLTITLGVFVILVLVLTTEALNQSIESSVHAEVRVAMVEVNRQLLSTPPYWPAHLSLQAVDTYRDPGVVIEVRDAKGNILYDSDNNAATRIPLSPGAARAILAGQTLDYRTHVDDGRVQVQAVPIHLPQVTANGETIIASGRGSAIGILLVAKSLSGVDFTLLMVQTLLILAGLVTLLVALISGWVIAAQVLRPLVNMVKTARAIALATACGTRIGNLNQRVRRPPGRDEMALVVDTFNDMLASLESATQVQRRFVADASHELRAPLTTIQGNLAFLQRHIDELPAEERYAMLSDAYAETLRLAQLVEGLLLLARADASTESSFPLSEQDRKTGNRLHRPQPVELDRVVLLLVRQFLRRLRIEESPLKLEIGQMEPVSVYGDEESLRRVILILLENAIKYTPTSRENREAQVIVSLKRREQEAVLHVRDTGIGIEATDLPHIFERFYRTDRARSRQGTGLGLAIAQTLIEQLGGHITATSVPGQGSTFSVWLPLT